MGMPLVSRTCKLKSIMIRSAILLALVGIACVASVNINKDELAQKAIDEALKLGMGVLDSVMTSFYDDAAKVCYWNDWEARDGRARIERTFAHGRMSKQKKTLGIPNGRWYCCYKQDALVQLGHDLD